MEKEFVTMNRREWLKRSAAGLTALAVAGAVGGCGDKTPPKRLEGNVRLPAKLPMLKRMDNGFTPLAISTMSMPKTGGKMAAEGIKIIQRAADAGVSLFDTAWAYADGDGERMLGEALSNRSRDSFMLSTSMPTFSVDTVAEAKVVFDRQLQLLRTDHVDYYSLQAIGSSDIYKEKYSDSGILAFLTKMLDEGKIRHLGIDYIGSDEDFLDALLSDRRFDFFRLPYNAIDDLRMNGAQSSAIFAAQDAGKLVFATNPTKDGMLRTLNGDATDVLYSAFPDRPIAGWALRAAARQEGVTTVVDSPSDLTMLAEDITAMALGTEFSEKESAVWETALKSYIANSKIHCIDCKRCMPCPYGINIPQNFTIHNALIDDDMLPNAYGDTASEAFAIKAKEFVRRMQPLDHRQSAFFCIGCGKCVGKCPQGIAIPQQMAHISLIIDKARERAAKDICDR